MIGIYDNENFHKAKRATFVFSSILIITVLAVNVDQKLNLLFTTAEVNNPIYLYIFLTGSTIYQWIVFRNRASIQYMTSSREKAMDNIAVLNKASEKDIVDNELLNVDYVNEKIEKVKNNIDEYHAKIKKVFDQHRVQFNEQEPKLGGEVEKLIARIKENQNSSTQSISQANQLLEIYNYLVQDKFKLEYYTLINYNSDQIDDKSKMAFKLDFIVPNVYGIIGILVGLTYIVVTAIKLLMG